MKQVLIDEYNATNRSAIPQVWTDGSILLLSQFEGADVPILIIGTNGQARKGSATLVRNQGNPVLPLKATAVKG